MATNEKNHSTTNHSSLLWTVDLQKGENNRHARDGTTAVRLLETARGKKLNGSAKISRCAGVRGPTGPWLLFHGRIYFKESGKCSDIKESFKAAECVTRESEGNAATATTS